MALHPLIKGLLPLLGLSLLGGCMQSMPLEAPAFLKGKQQEDGAEVMKAASAFSQPDTKAQSDILETLVARRSVLPESSQLAYVTDVALTSSNRAAEAQLKTAKLRAEAEDKNWLPTLGPTVSLTSLGDVVAGLVLDQVLFDHGRKKAERDYAAADVEVAAVSLSQDMNDRAYTALALYIKALRGQEKAALGNRALKQMNHFGDIVEGRVSGGVSNKGDLRMVQTKINTLRTMRDTASESTETALSELTAMTGTRFDLAPVSGVEVNGSVEALEVIKASAEAKRAVAQATVERAGQLPGLSATGTLANTGNSASLDLSTETGLGLGTGKRIQAIESTKETAKRQVEEAQEDSARSESRLRREIESLSRQEKEANTLARDGRQTYKLFEAQFRAGQRSVLEVVDVYEQSTYRALDGIDAKYDKILAQLQLARDMGLLANGDAI
ncbi:adhesin transport system outer membrane protein [Shimia isoporae]|uniref:Adhesin transport system outer membrane protein n=1 Tax=Shimia isoporae TaxID=647720 RepID=A0A4R1NLE6_9RHOB|nr:TolC family protein [Shimia isoporae]TCL09084.1 adhesin transport system outer membrane protein [Shimia isoporae]